jgi:hypothetical protein
MRVYEETRRNNDDDDAADRRCERKTSMYSIDLMSLCSLKNGQLRMRGLRRIKTCDSFILQLGGRVFVSSCRIPHSSSTRCPVVSKQVFYLLEIQH